MKLYNFKRLIEKYATSFQLIRESGGKYVGGKWEAGEKMTEERRGAIIPMSDAKIYGSGGTYTTKDRELFLTKPLSEPLSEYRVIHKGDEYAIESGKNFEDFADVAVYTLKYQSKRGEKA